MFSLVDAMIDHYTQTYSGGNTQTHYLFVNTATMAIKDILQAIMDQRGENPHSLSLKAKVPQPTIFRILKGTSAEPRRHNMEKLAKALGVDVEAFYGRPSKPLALVVNEPPHDDYLPPRCNEEERMMRALRLASPEQRRMLIQMADHILEDIASFDERAGLH